MRKVITAIAALILGVCCLSAAAQEVKPDVSAPITLDQALETAFRKNPTIQLAVAQINKGRGGVREAYANFMPKFNANVTNIHQGPQIAFQMPGTTTVINIVQQTDTTANGSVSLPIDISKRLGYVTDLAKFQLEMDYYGLLTASEQVIFRVKSAYYELLRAQGNQGVAQAAIDVSEEQLKDSKARFNAGTAAKFDVTRIETQLANQNQVLLQAKNRVGIARVVLNQVMGVNVETPTEVVKTEIKVEPLEVDLPVRTQEAYSLRPEVRSAVTSIQAAEKNIKLQRTGILPSLNANAVYNYDVKPTGFSSVNTSWIATLSLDIPIWDGGVTKAKVDQAHAQLQSSRDSLQQLKLTVGTEVGTAALNLNEATQRVATTAQGVDLAKESLRLAKVRYDAGIATLVEVTDAQSALTLANFNYVAAEYDYVLAVAEFQRATGTQPEIRQVEIICRIPEAYNMTK